MCPAARLGDNHTCPIITGPVPHVGGPITDGVQTVLIGDRPAAMLGSACVCTGASDAIVAGSTTVSIGGRPAARLGDPSAHGGFISMDCLTVLIGE
jgi:uncharacterized Zn-binding protein involved in type VI secretion